MKNFTYTKNMKVSKHFVSMKLNSLFSLLKTILLPTSKQNSTAISRGWGLKFSFSTLILALSTLLIGVNGWGQTDVDFTTTGQTTWTVPTGVSSVRVEVWGGGGGATGRISTSYSGAGGGGGTYARKVSFAVTAGDVLYVQVGAGGSGTTAGSNKTANDGGQSYVKTTSHAGTVIASANGGKGGKTGTTGTLTGSGAGSQPYSINATSPTTNDDYWNGGAGGGTSGTKGGGGGGGAGSGGSGGSGTTAGAAGTAGAALSTPYVGLAGGAGGACTGTNNAGTAGSTRGGGGAGCGSGSTSSGNAGAAGFVRITYTLCTNPTSAGAVASAQTICSGGNPAAFTSSSLPTGHSGTLQYKWQSSTTSSTTGFADIASTNSTIYDPPAGLTQTTWYRRLARVSCAADWTGAQATTAIEVTVNSAPTITTQPSNSPISQGSNTTFTVATSAGSPSYQWQYSANNSTWTNVANSTPTGATYTNATTATLSVASTASTPAATYYYRCVVTSASCPTNSNSATMVVSVPAPANDLCANATNLPCATSNLAGTTVGTVSETAPGSCVGGLGVWYSFTGNGGSTTITASSSMDIGLYVGSGNCTTRTQISCVDNNATNSNESTTFTTTNGTVYYVYIAYYSTAVTTGTFTISRTCATPPTITSFDPANGCLGTTVTITGTSLTGASAVSVGGTACTNITVVSATQVTAVLGSGTTGTISLTATAGSATSSGTFTVNAPPTLSYTGSPFSYTEGTAISTLSASTTGSPTTFSGSLPAGLSLNTSTGAITGTPNTPQAAASYTITGTAASGCTGTTAISIAVKPANVQCANATNLPCATSNLAGTTVGTTGLAHGISGTCLSGGGVSNYGVWYSFTGDGSSTTITIDPAAIDMELVILSGTCNNYTCVAGIDVGGAGATDSHTFTTVNGTIYYVYVAGYGSSSTTTDNFTISRTCTAAVAAPSNNLCQNPTALTVNSGTTCTVSSNGTTVAATESLAGCAGTADDDVWYSFVATRTTHFVTVTPGTLTDAVFQVYSGSCAALTSLLCEDNTSGSVVETNSISGLTVGNTYLVRVFSYESGIDQGTFTICVSSPVANDEVADAITLTTGASATSGTMSGATDSYGLVYINDVFYKFTPSCAGNYTITLNNFTPDFDIELHSSTAFNTGSYIAGSGGSTTTETFTATLAANTTYYIWLYDWNLLGGTFDLSVAVTTATTSNAGVDQTGAATCALTSVTLAGNTPTAGTGAWSIVSGIGGTVTTPSSPTSTFTGTAGSTYTLRWTITNCTSTSTDDVVITFNQNPTAAAAGTNQTNAATCGLTSVTLAGNTATVGTGAWSIISGTGGTVTTPSSPTSTFSGTAGSTYTLRWTISNSPCTASGNNVNIKFNQNPTTANAGADQTGAATCGLTSVTLAGNTPTVGTGAWSIISGTGGSVTTPSSATSAFTGTAGSTYTLRWTISNNPCTASTDDVVITFNQNPTTANAGADQTGAATCGLTSVTLAGNTATVGTGAWSIVAGTGGTVTTPSSPTSTFSGTAGSTYTLRWTITNSPCTASTDDVVVTFLNAFTSGTILSVGETICSGGDPGVIGSSVAASGGDASITYKWQANGVDISSSNSATYNPPSGLTASTTYTRWAKDGTCNTSFTQSSGSWIVTITTNNTASSASSSPSLCINAALTPITHTTTGATAIGTASNLPTGVSASWSGNTITISGTPTSSGTYNYSVPLTGGCGSVNATGTITVNAPVLAQSISPANGDYVWQGGISDAWGNTTNWLTYNGSSYVSAGAVPNDPAIRIFVPDYSGGCTTYDPTVAGSLSTDNITITVGAVMTISSGATLNLSGSLSNAGTLTFAATGTANVEGGWVNNGTFNAGSGTVVFNGTTNASIISGTNSFYNLSLNGGSALEVTLSNAITVSNTLTLTTGKVILGANNLTIGASGAISGGSSSSFVVTNSTGVLKQQSIDGSAAAGKKVFPIGLSTSSYTPMILANAGTSDDFSARVTSGVLQSGTSGSAITTKYINRTWLIDETSAGGSNATITLGWNAAEEQGQFTRTACFVTHYTGGSWDLSTATSASGNPYTTFRSGITSFSPFSVTSTSALPIELISFQANCANNNTVDITWSTATEHNTNYFRVDKSRDGLNWDVLNTIGAAGNSNNVIDYALTDFFPTPGINYYRLTQYDNDGVFETFDAQAAVCKEVIAGSSLTTYPNPSTSDFNVDLQTDELEGDATLVITDSKGALMHTQDIKIINGNNNYVIQKFNAEPGIYYITVKAGTSSVTTKHSVR
jgi:hypothetical protein